MQSIFSVFSDSFIIQIKAVNYFQNEKLKYYLVRFKNEIKSKLTCAALPRLANFTRKIERNPRSEYLISIHRD